VSSVANRADAGTAVRASDSNLAAFEPDRETL